jgi:glycosyltransferase involved in cell wall biosynthesis
LNIWIFNHHALTPDMGGGTRHYDFAKELIKKDHSVTIVASSFHYSKYQEMKEYEDKEYLIENIDGINFIWIKTPAYFGNGINRVKNMLSYTFKTLRIVPKLEILKPDIIIGSSVHLFAAFAAFKLSKRYNVPFIMEVRDLWPKTLIDMGMSKWHPFIILLGYLEKFLYQRADKVISNLPYAYDYIGQFVLSDKFVWISNGVNLSEIPYHPKLQNDSLVVTYAGSIGVANNLMMLVQAAEKLKHHRDIFFKIIGDGGEKAKLQAFITENQLKNITIQNSVPKLEIAHILSDSDALFLSLVDSPLYKYGISLNKIFDYMASGRIAIFAGNARNNPIKEANAGYTIPPNDINVLTEVILNIKQMSPKQRTVMGENARKHAEKFYATEILATKLEQVLEEVVDNHA